MTEEEEIAYRQRATQSGEKQALCPHMSFFVNAEVNRLMDTGRFSADIRIYCEDCGLPFHFKGLRPGLDHEGATVSVDSLEARLAIGPGMGGWFTPGSPHYNPSGLEDRIWSKFTKLLAEEEPNHPWLKDEPSS